MTNQTPLTPNNPLDNSLSSEVECNPTTDNAIKSLSTATPQPPSGTSMTSDSSTEASNETSTDLITTKPSNLLVTFLEYCSIVMQVTMLNISK